MRPLRTLFDRLASSSTSNDAGFSHFRRGIESSGLFGYHDLKQASDFQAVVELRTRQADELVRRVCAAREPHEMRLTVRRLDRLSDLLCSVVDTAELVRNVHPDREMASAANLAHVTLSNYLNRLNTHTGLYQVSEGDIYRESDREWTFQSNQSDLSSKKKALSKVFMNERLVSDMSHQERRVGRLLIKDFENSGIHMPDARRRRFVELNDKVLQLGQEFVTNSGPSVDYVKIKDPYSSLDGVSTRVIESLIPSSSTSSKSSKRHRPISSYAIIPIRHGVAYHILKSATNESVRERVFIGLNSGSIQQIQVLDEMLKTRGEIASLLGRKSYADLHLSDSMAKSPGK